MALVQHSTGFANSGNTVSATFSLNHTQHHLMVAAIGWSDITTTVTSVTDDLGNTYQLAISDNNVLGPVTQSIYYAPDIASGSPTTITVLFNHVTTLLDLRVSEWSGMLTASLVDATSFGANGQNIASTGDPMATSYDQVLLFAAGYTAGFFTGMDPPFHLMDLTSDRRNIHGYLLVYETGSYFATAVNNNQFVFQLVAFKTSRPFTGACAITPVLTPYLSVSNFFHGTALIKLFISSAMLFNNHLNGRADIHANSTGFITGGSPGVRYWVSQLGTHTQSGLAPGHTWSIAFYNTTILPTGDDTVFFVDTILDEIDNQASGTALDHILSLDFRFASLKKTLILNGIRYATILGGSFTDDALHSHNFSMIDFNGVEGHDVRVANWTYNGPDGPNAFGIFLRLVYCYNFILENCTLHGLSHMIVGDTIHNHEVIFRNNYFKGTANVIDQSDIIFLGDATNVLIEGNMLINQAPGDNVERHNDCIQTYRSGGSAPGNPTGWIVRYNWLQMDVSGGSGDASWTMMENMEGDPAIKIYSNVFVGNGTNANNGITFDACEPTAVAYLYNNTVIRHQSPDNTIRFIDPAGTLYSSNNLGMANTGQDGTFVAWTWAPGAPWDYNFFYRWLEFDPAVYCGPHGSTTVDPKFCDFLGNDFRLLSESSLIGIADQTLPPEYHFGLANDATWPNPHIVARTTMQPGAYDGFVVPTPLGGTCQIKLFTQINLGVSPGGIIPLDGVCLFQVRSFGSLTVGNEPPPPPPPPPPDGLDLIAQTMRIVIGATHAEVISEEPDPSPEFMRHGIQVIIPKDLQKLYETLYDESEYKHWI